MSQRPTWESLHTKAQVLQRQVDLDQQVRSQMVDEFLAREARLENEIARWKAEAARLQSAIDRLAEVKP